MSDERGWTVVTTRDEQPPTLALRAEEVARELGISRSIAYEWMANGTLPVVRIGRIVRVPRAALEEWLRVQTQPARRVG